MIALYAQRLLTWFDQYGRHHLPWQHPRTPYRVWISEIMLQQTQVAVVIPYFLRFLERFPTLPELAAADTDAVMAHWAGLGYYARARHLHAAAKRCVELHGGDLPHDQNALQALPGIGRSTAAAILSQAWNDRAPILDGNIKRVLSRLHGIVGWSGQSMIEKELWELAEAYVLQPPTGRLADYTQAQMDFGATVCTRLRPACLICPLQDGCVAWREGLTETLPTPKPSKVLPEREAVVLLLQNNDDAILLQRRPLNGIWAALWTLPQADTEAELRIWCAQHTNADYDLAKVLDPIVHTFSHYRVYLKPRYMRKVALHPGLENTDGLRWVTRTNLPMFGLPAPIRKLLNEL
ncbi:A/G-specific adenine glycosylase [Xylella fastidiosa]|uniref:Adenine DNA glycosylase n=1 Tax=Xylella fastidiosa subsp. multiplex TaxID=644357 RepID=A0A9Q4QST3_XYLFS|nr:A/G-specific adenine glycosylase [Xylella fastidiosa]ERI59619.1 DNA glycosylase [Xylella fastidiosa subsp. multiplex Griffin-1]ACA12015.1 A/G-specific adenine glycosylase [Xylella fastidiosa M12]KAJ4851744.1 A/G-specific adenine glycosylase [Xylella fastidiosa subsp. multiplex]KAJ4852731.1 A/G-specific adenine glycosylase [Xylella fastidiosa subsp. multiplex]KFA40764.1 A/G-specific adenine glycosylase [Xylella fastidiosa]